MILINLENKLSFVEQINQLHSEPPIHKLNSEDFTEFFFCAEISYVFVRKSLIFKNFSTFVEVFRAKLFCAARCSHVICTIRFALKFHIGLYICGHSEVQWKNDFIPKTVKKRDFTWVKIAWVHSKSNKPTLKSISKSPDS